MMKRLLKKNDLFTIRRAGKTSGIYLVTDVALTGGGTGHGPFDVYPDGHKVTAQRVIALYNISNRKKEFYQTGCFSNKILPKEIEFLGRAKVSMVVTDVVCPK